MYRQFLRKVAQFGVVGVSGYIIGQYCNEGKIIDEGSVNKDLSTIIINGKSIKSLPGLPIFGTVSAAAPYSDSAVSKDRVCILICFYIFELEMDKLNTSCMKKM